MELSQELLRAKEVLKQDGAKAYREEVNGDNVFTLSTSKTLTITGGQEKLEDLRDGYDSLFVDPVVPEVEGGIKEADGTFTMCTQAEWDELIRLMRLKGRELFEKHEALVVKIDAINETYTFDAIWKTTWANQ